MSFFGAIGNAFHSAERSIEHTAKNVAHAAAQAEKSVVKTVLHVEKQVEHAAKVVVHDTVQISKEAKQAFHSAEKSIEHSAKNVAHEAAQAEKKVVQTVKNPEQTAKQIKTALSKYKESAVAFGTGAGDAALTDVTLGTFKKDSNSNHPVAYKAGEMIGHAVSTLGGIAEVGMASVVGAGGIALSATGEGILLGAPAIAIAAAGATHGISVATKGTYDLVQNGKDLYNLAVHNGEKIAKSANNSGKAEILNQNRKTGREFEKKSLEEMKNSKDSVVEQITIKSKDGTKTRLDGIGIDKNTGQISIEEYKGSSKAPLTKNQKAAFPQIEKSGGVVVGKGKPPFTGGTEIPPTKVKIVKKK